jgi:hypothetical protein
MLKKLLLLRKSSKRGYSLLIILFLLLTTYYVAKNVSNRQLIFSSTLKAAYNNNPLYPARNVVVYEPPKFSTSGVLLTNAQVVQRFSVVIYAHNQMKSYFTNYAGFNGDSLVYLVADSIQGPQNLASVTAQSKTCAENGVVTNPSVLSGQAAMNPGDFCEIHDAIARKTSINETGYRDIYPTENWFIHRLDGSRLEKVRSGTSNYQPNPGDPNWQKYFTRRTLRELVDHYQGIEYPDYVPNIDGLFIDNLELSWYKLYTALGQNPPKEYQDSGTKTGNCAYTESVRSFAAYIHSQLHTNDYHYPVWANMISDNLTDPCGVGQNSWTPFDYYLEGGMDESFVLNWGKDFYDVGHVETEMAIASDWVKRGNHFMAIAQGDNSVYVPYNMYAFAAYLMTTDGVDASYKYANLVTASYNLYYSLNSTYPDYNYPLGVPTSDRYKSSTSPSVWKRNFSCGQVEVNLTAHSGQISLIPNCSITPTSVPTYNLADLNKDGLIDYLDQKIMLPLFNTSNSTYNLIGTSLIDIFDVNHLFSKLFKTN